MPVQHCMNCRGNTLVRTYGVTLLGTNRNKPFHLHTCTKGVWCPRRLTQIPDTRAWMFKVCGHQAGTMTQPRSYIQDTLWQGGQVMPSIQYSSSPGWLLYRWPWAAFGYLVFYLHSGQLCLNLWAPSGVITALCLRVCPVNLDGSWWAASRVLLAQALLPDECTWLSPHPDIPTNIGNSHQF